MEQENAGSEKKNNLAVPVAIIIAGAFIAGAIFYTSGKPATPIKGTGNTAGSEQPADIPPVTSADHILGNPDAPIVLVEYSDTECPYCKVFHQTLNQVMSEYGKDGKVAWIYRHFPLDAIHPKTRNEANGAECANELGGPEKFWAYLNRIFEITPSNNGLDPAQVPQIAKDIGLDIAAFNACLSANKYKDVVENDLQGGIKAGITGTPTTFAIIKKTGEKIQIPGAQPFTTLKTFIDSALSK